MSHEELVTSVVGSHAHPGWFVAGIAADLLETRHRQLVQAAVWGLLVANAAWHVWELARAGRG